MHTGGRTILTPISNKSIVLRLIQKATENRKTEPKGILGKKALQKSIYLFSLKHGRFNFKWADYGPFNVEVQQIVQDLMHGNRINISYKPTHLSGAVIQNMQYNTSSEPLEEFPEDMDKTLGHIVRFIDGRTPRNLELLASVHYWAQRQQLQTGKYDAEYIYQRLTELKPRANFTEHDVTEALQELEKGGFSPVLEK